MFSHPSLDSLSPGSLRVWVLVGIAVMAVALVALRPVVKIVEDRTRLAVAQQTLATYRYAVLAYSTEVPTVPPEILFEIPAHKSPDPEKLPVPAATSDEPKQSPSPSLGELLVSTKKIDRVAFPMGQKNLLPEDGEPDPLQIHQPKILAVSLPSLADYFKNPQLFSSARSSQVAVLVVPYLDESEAESIQKIIGSLSELQNGKTVYRGDCFFTRSSVEGKFNGWIYLSDL